MPDGSRGSRQIAAALFCPLRGVSRPGTPLSPSQPCTPRHLPPQGNSGHYPLYRGVQARGEGRGGPYGRGWRLAVETSARSPPLRAGSFRHRTLPWAPPTLWGAARAPERIWRHPGVWRIKEVWLRLQQVRPEKVEGINPEIFKSAAAVIWCPRTRESRAPRPPGSSPSASSAPRNSPPRSRSSASPNPAPAFCPTSSGPPPRPPDLSARLSGPLEVAPVPRSLATASDQRLRRL